MRRFVELTVVTGLIVSALANGVLVYLLGSAFGELHHARIFPLGSSALPEPTVDDCTIAVYGDSRALSWGRFLQSRRDGVLNFAVGGTTTNQLYLRLLSDKMPQSRVAIVQTGINDLHPAGALHEDPATILRNLRISLSGVVEQLLETSDSVLLTTIIPPASVPVSRLPFWDQATIIRIHSVNEFLRGLSGQYPRVYLLDVQPILADASGWLKLRYADDDFYLHLNEMGYEALNESLNEMLEELISNDTSFDNRRDGHRGPKRIENVL